MIRKLLFFVRFLCVCIGHWGLCSVGHWDLCSVGHWDLCSVGHWDSCSVGHWNLCSVGHWDLCSVGHWNVILIWITLPMRATSDASPHYGPKMNADLDFRASW